MTYKIEYAVRQISTDKWLEKCMWYVEAESSTDAILSFNHEAKYGDILYDTAIREGIDKSDLDRCRIDIVYAMN